MGGLHVARAMVVWFQQGFGQQGERFWLGQQGLLELPLGSGRCMTFRTLLLCRPGARAP